jgi:hypothetical protein
MSNFLRAVEHFYTPPPAFVIVKDGTYSIQEFRSSICPTFNHLLLRNQSLQFNATLRDSLVMHCIVHLVFKCVDPYDFGVSHIKQWTLLFQSHSLLYSLARTQHFLSFRSVSHQHTR